MRVENALVVATAVSLVGFASGENVWESAFETLVAGCLKNMASCHDGKGNLFPSYNREECERNGRVWHQPFETAAEFRIASEGSQSKTGAFLARVTDVQVFRTSAGPFLTNENLYCKGGNFAVLDGSQEDMLTQVEGIDFLAAIPHHLKKSPTLAGYERKMRAEGKNTVARRIVLNPSARKNASLLVQRWNKAHMIRHRFLSESKLVFSVGRGLTQSDPMSNRADAGDDETIQSVEENDQPNFILVKGPSKYKADMDKFEYDGEVLWVEPDYVIKTSNQDAALITHAGVNLGANDVPNDSMSPFWAFGLTGKDQVIGMGDSGVDMEHCYFRDPTVDEGDRRSKRVAGSLYSTPTHRKVVQYFAYQDAYDGYQGHGTHVAGTIAGYPALSTDTNQFGDAKKYKGIAFDAKLAIADIGNQGRPSEIVTPSNISIIFEYAYQAGARIHSNSWGMSSNDYGWISQSMDQYTFNRQDFLIVIAAGNDGPSAGSIGAPATAKNVLSVGASFNSDHLFNQLNSKVCDAPSPCANNLANYSSTGPTFDGRVKPDLVAPGHYTISASGASDGISCSIYVKTGTSMATPVVSANAAIIRQFLLEGYYPNGAAKKSGIAFYPMGALVKAALIHSAKPITGAFAGAKLSGDMDYAQGYGLMQLDRVLLLGGNTQAKSIFFYGDMKDMPKMKAGSVVEYNFRLSSDPSHFRATMAWFDPPAALTAARTLVNDIDMEIEDPNGAVFHPNNLYEPDALNTVEHINIPPQYLVPNGEYIVRVSASRITTDNQPYALVVGGSIASAGNGTNITIIPGEPSDSSGTDGVETSSSGPTPLILGIGIAGGALLLIGSGIVLYVVIAKKSTTASSAGNRQENYLVASSHYSPQSARGDHARV